MARAEEAEPARFFIGVLAANQGVLSLAQKYVVKEWGEPDLYSGIIDFKFTNYYDKEIGNNIIKAFWGFPKLFYPDKLAHCKIKTNYLEEIIAKEANLSLSRPVNLDPGYLTLDKLVLASAKNFSHRIYLTKGIYAEITLQFRHGKFISLPWTFPDYASRKYDEFFLSLRSLLATERKERLQKNKTT